MRKGCFFVVCFYRSGNRADKKEKRAMLLNKKSSLFVNSVKVINQSMPKQIE